LLAEAGLSPDDAASGVASSATLAVAATIDNGTPGKLMDTVFC
jgi:hypothetical protein